MPEDPRILADLERHPGSTPVEGLLILRPNVPLTFVNADVAKDQILVLVRAAPEPPRAVILDISATADLDVATTDMLTVLINHLSKEGIELRLAQVRGSVRDRMRRTGLMTTLGEERCYLTTMAAVLAPLPERIMQSPTKPADAPPESEPGPKPGATPA